MRRSRSSTGSRRRARTGSSRSSTAAAIFRDDRPNVWDFNFLRVERGEPTAAELVAAANELMAHLDHRRVVVDDAALAARLEPEFPSHAWTVERHLVMECRRPPQARGASAREASREELEPLWAELGRRRGFEVDMRGVTEAVVATRYFAAFADGVPVSCCELYSRDGVAQVEDVVTLEEHRGRGLASAAVLAALDASLAERNTLTFLLADADDWPYLPVRAARLRDDRPPLALPAAPERVAERVSGLRAPPYGG